MGAVSGVIDFASRPGDESFLQAMSAGAAHYSVGEPSSIALDRGGLAYLSRGVGVEGVGQQPLWKDDLWLVADLRLDNREELLLALMELVSEDSPSDAELVLAAYRRWGPECTDVLLGDFSFILWDAPRERVLAARDPLGVKPLCYARLGPLICLASEAQQILRHPAISADLDEVAIVDYLCGAATDRDRTFFQNVQSLPPAHRLIADREGLAVERYWDIDPGKQTNYHRPEEYAEHLRELLARSVADRLRGCGDRAAIAMSGGLDSCSVAALARRVVGWDEGPELVVSSFVFDTLLDCDERPFIRTVADDLGLERLEVQAENYWFLSDDQAFEPDLESPYVTAWEGSYQELADQLQERGISVLLTGNGGDEMLCGSWKIYADRLRRRDFSVFGEVRQHARQVGLGLGSAAYKFLAKPLLSSKNNQRLRRLTGRGSDPTLQIPAWIDSGLAQRTAVSERLQKSRSPLRIHEMARQEIYDQAVGLGLCGPPCHWYGRRPRRTPLDVRHPFLDRRIAEFVCSVPTEQLVEPGVYKPLLRKAMDGVLPESVRLRPDKTKLGRFVDLGLRDMAAGRVRQLLKEPLIEELGFVNGKELRSAYEQYSRTWPTEAMRNVAFPVTLELWLQCYHEYLLSGRSQHQGQALQSEASLSAA